jgi:hypothetical protein
MPSRFFQKLNHLNGDLDKQLEEQTSKCLKRLQKKETQLKKRLYQLDSNKTKNLFLLNTEQQYAEYGERIKNDSVYDRSKTSGEYAPNVDSLQGSLSFLNKNPALLGNSVTTPAELQRSLAGLEQFEAKMQDADQLKQYIATRKQEIKQYLMQFAHLPPGITSIYNDYNKELYYYNAQLNSYKEMLSDPDKMMSVALSVLEKMPAFQSFMASNSMLSGLFPGSANLGSPQAIAGLQTRNDLSQMISGQLSGSNGQAVFSDEVSNAQSELSSLKDKLSKYGAGGGDMDMPDFKPNDQRTKTFLKRLQFGTNIQTQQSTHFFPVTTDLGLSVGYRLDNGNTAGLGASYKIGWGSDFGHIRLTSQGASLRSFIDIHIKRSFYASGGLEYNYQQPFKFADFPNWSAWQPSGLIGISKIVSMNTKIFKQTKLQLFWDPLSYSQVPKGQPFKFRVGYNF